MLVEAIRLIIVLVTTAGAYTLDRSRTMPLFGSDPQASTFWVTAIGAGIGYIAGGLTARTVDRILQGAERKLAERHASEILASLLGLLVGLALGSLLAWPFLVFVSNFLIGAGAAALIIVICTAFGVRVATRKRLELFGVLGIAPVVASGGCLLDSSAVIDGRVLSLYRAGMLPSPVMVPSFILWELQTLADSSSDEKRRRGKRGLEVLTSLRESGAAVKVTDADPAGSEEADAKLVVMAKRNNVPIVTSDSVLASAASVDGVSVLNLHALSDLLRPPLAAGDELSVSVVKTGRSPGQGVGYLPDGSMIVIDQAAERIGSTVAAVVTNVMQTPAGRLVFARLP